jgi:hypothetical protein
MPVRSEYDVQRAAKIERLLSDAREYRMLSKPHLAAAAEAAAARLASGDVISRPRAAHRGSAPGARRQRGDAWRIAHGKAPKDEAAHG